MRLRAGNGLTHLPPGAAESAANLVCLAGSGLKEQTALLSDLAANPVHAASDQIRKTLANLLGGVSDCLGYNPGSG